jgi:hypothetical protein
MLVSLLGESVHARSQFPNLLVILETLYVTLAPMEFKTSLKNLGLFKPT